MMADEFGGPVPVGPFAIIGDDSIGRGIVQTLSASRSPAVLMRNHGPFTIAPVPLAAGKAAGWLERVRRPCHTSARLGELLRFARRTFASWYTRYQTVNGQ